MSRLRVLLLPVPASLLRPPVAPVRAGEVHCRDGLWMHLNGGQMGELKKTQTAVIIPTPQAVIPPFMVVEQRRGWTRHLLPGKVVEVEERQVEVVL